MKRARFVRLTALLITGILMAHISVAGAQVGDDRETFSLEDGEIQVIIEGGVYQVSFDGGQTFSRQLPQRTEIKLRFATFDPLVDGEPEIPPGLAAPPDADAFLVQFKTQPLDAYRAIIEDLGGTVHTYVPDQAHIVRMTPALMEEVEALPFVRWVGPYHPAYKLEEELVDRLTGPIIEQEPVPQQEEPPLVYSIMLLERGQALQSEAMRIVTEAGGTVEGSSPLGFRLEALLTDDQIREIVAFGGILFIDRFVEPEEEPVPLPAVDMDIVRDTSGANVLEDVEGYTGQGVRGEVMDSRLRETHQDFQANPPILHPNTNVPTQNCAGDGHGTCVYGIIFGDGAGNAQARGLLPDGQGIYADRSFVGDRYAHTAELVDPTDVFRAVFQSNSWGGGLTTQYNTVSAEMDDIIFINDILITQSQSNQGSQMSRPQAWAKNIVAVGGVFHQNTLDRDDDTWNSGGASIGPASDGRVKPELAHFYDSTFTTNSTADNTYFQFGGTSGATPITAGYFGLMFQMWADGVFSGGPGQGLDVFDSRPSAATARALMINSAFQYDFVGGPAANQAITRNVQGWGAVDAGNLYDLARQHNWDLPILIDESEALDPLDTHDYEVSVGADACFMKATLVYRDPMGNPAATQHRINDLSLRLTSPGGTTYWGNNGLGTALWSTPGGSSDTINTVENVFIEEAEQGDWTIEVLGDEIVEDANLATGGTDAAYSLVVTTCAEVDAEVESLAVTGPPEVVNPPHEILADENVEITLEAVVANNGPGGPHPADFDVTFNATAPTDCQIVGPAQASESVSLSPGEDETLEVQFVIHCTEASFHTFDFDAEIAIDAEAHPDVRDPDPTNNTADIEMEVGVVKQVEVSVAAIGFDTDRLRAVINPVEPGEPMMGLGPLAAPWDGTGDRPLPWARTENPLPGLAQCPDPQGHIPQPGHGNWENPRDPITLVVPDPGEPISLFVDLLDCTEEEVNVDTTVTLTVIDGACHFGGDPDITTVQAESSVAGWNITLTPVEFADAITLSDSGCTVRVDVSKEPSEIHFELLGETSGSIDVELVPARDGRMTGGGSVFDENAIRYTHGFQLHCEDGGPNNLPVNWDGGNRFHLEDVVAVLCFDDPAINESPPEAGFDTILGNVLGRLNGQADTPLWFHFTDAGQPGDADLAEFVIDGGPLITDQLNDGNHQAHAPRGRPGP